MKDQLLDIAGLAELVQEMKDYISDYVLQNKVVPCPSISLFPSIGKTDTIYIDTTHNTIYRWDDENVKYYPLAFDSNDTYILDCNSDDL